MSNAGYYEMTWTRGNTFDTKIQPMNGPTPFVLTGYELVFRIVDNADTEYLKISSEDVGSGISIGTDEDGNATLIEFDIAYTVTRNAPSRPLTYAIERRLAGTPEKQHTLLKGPLKIIKDANDDV